MRLPSCARSWLAGLRLVLLWIRDHHQQLKRTDSRLQRIDLRLVRSFHLLHLRLSRLEGARLQLNEAPNVPAALEQDEAF